MLTVGIHENLVFEKASVNEKGTLGISFRPAKLNATEDSTEVYDIFSDEGAPVDSVTGSSSGNSFLIFCPKKPTFKTKEGNDLSDKEAADFIRRDFETLHILFTKIIGAYRPTKDLRWAPYKGTGVTKDNYETELLNEDTQKKVYANYCELFIEAMAPFADDDKFKVRLKLVRQNKDKHFATLPTKYIDTNPFIEPMEVPAASSQVKYTKWEIDKGLNDGTPVAKAEADAIPETTEEGTQSVFGVR